MKKLLPTKAVREICGISEMTLWRWLHDDGLGFPKPVVIRNRRYWDADHIEAFRARVFRTALHGAQDAGRRAAS
ncbi:MULTISPECIES: helix-turn-helix transcriptional regulator [Bradyrhizobium]|jgi:predicted DNA-binding transcriptional regulator AlpA|uniref:helix-turn-helix transcriptional regulator n=1 Tax=Bradyrhizobium TaxID=374 RepID=UPI0003A1F6EA|nr:hypothetical protein [Bradyrhizobium denitrificans]MCL8489214.1 hypothetical protein [Bradyrhizobium denitrificans]